MKSLNKKIVFSCDSNNKIGLGHLVRCLAVANHLKEKLSITFATDIDESNTYIKNDYETICKKQRRLIRLVADYKARQIASCLASRLGISGEPVRFGLKVTRQ